MDIQDEENMPETDNLSLRKKLGVAVRSVQWSYAIFWAFSTTQQGVLEWGEGHYNGDIKTRKAAQSKDFDAHRLLGLQRSEQLRKLYQSLLESESELGTKTPSGALSPEDLSNLEWYYLVCMSFTFKFGQSLPGRALATGQHIWLFDAQSADIRVFSRSLLAKSASVQTVICFPHMGGVIELGTTDLVPEDLNLIQYVKTTLMEVVKPICSEKNSADLYDADYDDYYTDRKPTENGHDIVDAIPFSKLYPSGEYMKSDKDKQNDLHHNVLEDITICSANDCSNDCCKHTEESIMLHSTASPFRNWHLINEDRSQSLQDSTTFHGCLSQNFDSQEEHNLPPDGKNIGTLRLETFQDWGASKIMCNTHYGKTLPVTQENTNHFITDQNKSICGQTSSFLNWRKDFRVHGSRTQASQKTLKTILFKVPLMHAHSTSKSFNKEGSSVYPLKSQACRSYGSQSTSEEGADNGMLWALDQPTDSGQYLVLKSMLPSVAKVPAHSLSIPFTRSLTKIRAQEKKKGNIFYFRSSDQQLTSALMAFQTDETSILIDTIEYLKELEARVDELESCIDFEGSSAMRDLELDLVEYTSDNYEGVEEEKQAWTRKRKASEIHETDTDLSKAIQKDIQPLDVKVDVAEDEVLIRVNCPWREHLLLDIMEAANDLNLDTHTVQSSTLDGILSLFLKSKIQRTAFSSEGVIKQDLRRAIGL